MKQIGEYRGVRLYINPDYPSDNVYFVDQRDIDQSLPSEIVMLGKDAEKINRALSDFFKGDA